ncbi:MAG TPA: FKBP-type peptidyl-prolyl cis-trans isomerase [Candidatus Saccharimonadales bacterium]|jgi:FKBP-type peptidyl-prolyl cis-trans isomerase
MATSTGQRIGIWIIAIVMSVGTLGAFFLPILTSKNAEKDSADQQKMMEELQRQQAASVEPLEGYQADPFDKASVTELKVEELKPGEGKEAKADSDVNVNYFGWTSDGKIFDSSRKSGATTPIDLNLGQVIPGWAEGMTGAKKGAVRKLTIPAAKAYGEQGQPPTIGPNEPLTFIIEVKDVK